MENSHGYGDLEAAANEITSLRSQLLSARNELRSTQADVRALQKQLEERYNEGREAGIRIGRSEGTP